MDTHEANPPGYEQTLPALSRPPAAAAWMSVSDLIPALPHTPESLADDIPPVSNPNTQPLQPTQATLNINNAPSKVCKRKANNASAGKSTLFWVNTDPQSASSGTKEETLKRIRSHVMSEHNRKKRLESTKRFKSKTSKDDTLQTSQVTSRTAATAGSHFLPLESASSSSPDSRRSSDVTEQAGLEQELVSTTAVGFPAESESSMWDSYGYDAPVEYSAGQMPSLWDRLGQGAHDPFDTAHTKLTDRMLQHVQYFLMDLTQEAHPLQTRYKPKLQAHWASLIQRDPAILHASICMASSNAALQRGELPLKDPNQQRSPLVLDSFHHRGETIRLVNEGLSDPVKASSDELIAAVSTLLTIEIASGNPDYLKIHLAGLRQMIALRENFADVPSDIRFQISWTDVRVACMAHAKPIFPFLRGTRPARFSLVPPNDDVALLATRLISMTRIPGIFGGVMSQLIYDLLELSWYAEWIKAETGYMEFNEETEDYFNNEVLYVEYSLHKDRYTASGEVKGDNSIEGCCRLACLLFHNSAIWSFYPSVAPLLPKPILALRTALAATIPTGLFALCRDLLVWLLFTGASCSAFLPEARTFFVSELANTARLQGISTWQEARFILLGFFYVDRVHLPMLRQIWDEVQLQAS